MLFIFFSILLFPSQSCPVSYLGTLSVEHYKLENGKLHYFAMCK